MIRAFPFLFVILWSSAFISGKIIVEDASPFAALGFRFALVASGFFCFALILKDSLSARSRDIFEACGTRPSTSLRCKWHVAHGAIGVVLPSTFTKRFLCTRIIELSTVPEIVYV